MIVRFLKDHLKDKAGDVRDVEEGIALYMLRLGVVESPDEKKVIETGKEKKVFKKHIKEKKSNAGPGK